MVVTVLLTGDPVAMNQAVKISAAALAKQTTDTIVLGDSVYVAILFSGCQPGADGKCNVTTQSTVNEPKGKKVPAKPGYVWRQVPPKNSIQVGEQGLHITVVKPDPVGLYQVVTQVTDEVSKQSATLTTSFMVK